MSNRESKPARARDPHSEAVSNPGDEFLELAPESLEEQPTVEEALEREQALREVARRQGREPFMPGGKFGRPRVVSPPVEGGESAPMSSDLATAIASMQAEIRSLKEQVVTLQSGSGGELPDGVVGAGPTGFPWQYYKRPNRGPMAGWVVVAPGGAGPSGRRDVGAYAHYMAKGMKPLTRYGPAEIPVNVNHPGREYARLIENGGAEEFPVAQVISLRWHISPPVPGIIFPDYEANKDRVRHFMCEDCDFELWYMDDDRETASACFRHLRNSSARDGRHGYSRREAVALMKSQGLKPPTGQFADQAAREEFEAVAKPD